jgi:hypothetical protein
MGMSCESNGYLSGGKKERKRGKKVHNASWEGKERYGIRVEILHAAGYMTASYTIAPTLITLLNTFHPFSSRRKIFIMLFQPCNEIQQMKKCSSPCDMLMQMIHAY